LNLRDITGLNVIARLIETRNESDAQHLHALILMAAAKTGEIDEVKRLITAEAIVNERAPTFGSADDAKTPMGIAAREGHADIVRVLIDANANVSRLIGLMKGTPIHEAAYFGYADVLRTLTKTKRDSGTPMPELDAQGSYNGLTALHDAVWHGHLEAAQVLVDASARLDLKTHAGLTPRNLAVLYGYEDLAQLLAEAERK
jgi:uncharacterized protein